ncbi:hypothetical protein GC177_10135 [bacterium]|nr:hypothetical protein [bacterium]
MVAVQHDPFSELRPLLKLYVDANFTNADCALATCDSLLTFIAMQEQGRAFEPEFLGLGNEAVVAGLDKQTAVRFAFNPLDDFVPGQHCAFRPPLSQVVPAHLTIMVEQGVVEFMNNLRHHPAVTLLDETPPVLLWWELFCSMWRQRHFCSAGQDSNYIIVETEDESTLYVLDNDGMMSLDEMTDEEIYGLFDSIKEGSFSVDVFGEEWEELQETHPLQSAYWRHLSDLLHQFPKDFSEPHYKEMCRLLDEASLTVQDMEKWQRIAAQTGVFETTSLIEAVRPELDRLAARMNEVEC